MMACIVGRSEIDCQMIEESDGAPRLTWLEHYIHRVREMGGREIKNERDGVEDIKKDAEFDNSRKK